MATTGEIHRNAWRLKMFKLIGKIAFIIVFLSSGALADDRPFWTEKSSYLEGKYFYAVGVASNVKTKEEGRKIAFQNAMREIFNYLQLSDLGTLTIETQMTYEEMRANNSFDVFRLLRLELSELNGLKRRQANSAGQRSSSDDFNERGDSEFFTKKKKLPAEKPHKYASIDKQAIGLPVTLRKYGRLLSKEDVKEMLIRYNFFDNNLNSSGNFKNDFKDNGDGTITDRATGLMWQKSATYKYEYGYYFSGIGELNHKRFAGYSDWRPATLEELTSLIEDSRMNDLLYIDPIFDRTAHLHNSADHTAFNQAWCVKFETGYVTICYGFPLRAVRSLK